MRKDLMTTTFLRRRVTAEARKLRECTVGRRQILETENGPMLAGHYRLVTPMSIVDVHRPKTESFFLSMQPHRSYEVRGQTSEAEPTFILVPTSTSSQTFILPCCFRYRRQ